LNLSEAITDLILLKLMRGDAKLTLFKVNDKEVQSGPMSYQSALFALEKINVHVFQGKARRVSDQDETIYNYRDKYKIFIRKDTNNYYKAIVNTI